MPVERDEDDRTRDFLPGAGDIFAVAVRKKILNT